MDKEGDRYTAEEETRKEKQEELYRGRGDGITHGIKRQQGKG